MFQSTHSLRSATLVVLLFSIRDIVSIHALLAECDGQAVRNIPIPVRFNPRTPCGVRQETALTLAITGSFNPRTPCGVRREKPLTPVAMNRFNPRTPCGVRHTIVSYSASGTLFQSTHSLRSATGGRRTPPGLLRVSIHALLAECDPRNIHKPLPGKCFNPRTPCGVRQSCPPGNLPPSLFQSTHSLRSATSPSLFRRPP